MTATGERSSTRSATQCCRAALLGFFVITLDALVVNVALPDIGRELGGGMTGLQWVLDGYTLMFAALLLSAGSFSDRIGGSRAAAIGNGLWVSRLDLAVYTAAAVTAGAAGILYASRVGSGQVNAGGATSTLTVFTAVLIGGVSLMGGLGTIQGVAIGSVLLSLIDNALVLSRVPPTYNSVIIGAILIAAVALDYLRRQRLYRRR